EAGAEVEARRRRADARALLTDGQHPGGARHISRAAAARLNGLGRRNPLLNTFTAAGAKLSSLPPDPYMNKRHELTARNFPSAQQEAEVPVPSRYAGPESAYHLAFTDTDFLLREELRPVRMQLELLDRRSTRLNTSHAK